MIGRRSRTMRVTRGPLAKKEKQALAYFRGDLLEKKLKERYGPKNTAEIFRRERPSILLQNTQGAVRKYIESIEEMGGSKAYIRWLMQQERRRQKGSVLNLLSKKR